MLITQSHHHKLAKNDWELNINITQPISFLFSIGDLTKIVTQSSNSMCESLVIGSYKTMLVQIDDLSLTFFKECSGVRGGRQEEEKGGGGKKEGRRSRKEERNEKRMKGEEKRRQTSSNQCSNLVNDQLILGGNELISEEGIFRKEAEEGRRVERREGRNKKKRKEVRKREAIRLKAASLVNLGEKSYL